MGGFHATLTATKTSFYQLDPTIASPDPAISTLVNYRNSDYAFQSASPFSGQSSLTIVFACWVNLGTQIRNPYVFHMTDDAGETIDAAVQHAAVGGTEIQTNLMFTNDPSDWAIRNETVTVEQATGWIFCAWEITSSGTTRTCRHWTCFEGGTLTERTLSIPSVVATGWTTSLHPQLGISNDAQSVNVQHFRIWTSTRTLEQLNAAMLSRASDATCWAHWKLEDGDLADYSGNARDLNGVGELWPGVAGPTFASEATSSAVLSGTYQPLVDAQVLVDGTWRQIVEVQVLANGVWNPIVP